MKRFKDERVKQVSVGVAILIVLTVMVPGLLLGWRSMPGLLGEWVGTLLGIMTTPFCMEASFAVIGLGIVIALNLWRQHRDGDDFVDLEQATATGKTELTNQRPAEIQAATMDTTSQSAQNNQP